MKKQKRYYELDFASPKKKVEGIRKAIEISEPSEQIGIVLDISGMPRETDTHDSYLSAYAHTVIVDGEIYVRAFGQLEQSDEKDVDEDKYQSMFGSVSVGEIQQRSGNGYFVFVGGDLSQLDKFEEEYDRLYGYREEEETEKLGVDGWVIAERSIIRSGKLVKQKDLHYSNLTQELKYINTHSDILISGSVNGAGLYNLYSEKLSAIAFSDSRDALKRLSGQNNLTHKSINTSDIVVVGVRALGPKHEFWQSTLGAIEQTLNVAVKGWYGKNATDETRREISSSVAKDKRYFEKKAIDLAKAEDVTKRQKIIQKGRSVDETLASVVKNFWEGNTSKSNYHYTSDVKCVACPAGFIYSASSILKQQSNN